MEHNKQNSTDWLRQDSLSAIPAIAIGVSSVCFILGLLIVNLRLAQYGIVSSEFVRTEYILAGAMLLLFCGIEEASFRTIRKGWTQAKKDWDEKKHADAIFRTAFVLGAFIFPLPIVLSLVWGGGNPSFKQLVGAAIPIFLMWPIITALLSEVKDNILSGKSKIFDELGTMGMVLVVVFVSLSMYANATYANISSAYGGGYRTPKILFPTPSGLEVCKTLKLPILNDKLVGPMSVLTESEQEIIVLIPNEVSGKEIAIRLDRDMFEAIQSQPR